MCCRRPSFRYGPRCPYDRTSLMAGGSTVLATDTAEAVHWAFVEQAG